jgi:hypothetical protein
LSSRDKANDAYACDSTVKGCTTEQIGHVKSLDADADKARNFAIVGFAVGAAGIGTGLVLLLTDGPSDAGSGQALGPIRGLRIGAGPNFVTASGRF